MIRNSSTSYGSLAKTFHWLLAALILTMIPLGVVATGMANADPLKPFLFSVHKTLGLFIFFTALARILWAMSQPKPGTLGPKRKVEHFLAHLVHWLLYAALILVPLTGWIHHAATTGFAPIWWPFGQGLPFVPVDDAVAHRFKALHIIFERVLVLALLLHLAGALKHHFIDKDDTLRRMWPGARVRDSSVKQHTPHGEAWAAIAVYIIAIGIGAGLGLFEHQKLQAATLEQKASQWQVEEGTLAITVKQLGSDVDGQFTDWSAAINFDETANAQGVYGDVDVQIAIASLTLGSVTDQAMGPDFFDATSFPIARFQAEILAAETGYIAQGDLQIKDRTMPITLPFDLQIDADRAQMTSNLTLDRTDFNIGLGSQPTEGSLGFNVGVRIALTATR